MKRRSQKEKDKNLRKMNESGFARGKFRSAEKNERAKNLEPFRRHKTPMNTVFPSGDLGTNDDSRSIGEEFCGGSFFFDRTFDSVAE
jgi:hypothetical protein